MVNSGMSFINASKLRAPVLIIQFESAACAPCRAIRQRIESWISEHPMAAWQCISIDERPDIAAEFGIFSVPAVAVYVEGRQTIMESGYFSLDDLLDRTVRYMSLLPFRIRRASEADIEAVSAIYESVLQEEEEGKYTIGWIRGVYPTEDTARDSVRKGELFVLEEEGRILASARINHEQMPAYAEVSWAADAADNDSQVMVMHTLTVDPAMTGRGAGKHFLDFYEYYSLQNGSHILRIDTNERNKNARRIYAEAGYTERGIIPCEFNSIPDVHLVCMEKVLRQD